MDPMDKAILTSLYLSMMDPEISGFERMNSRLPLAHEIYEAQIKRLTFLGFIDKNDESRLTFIGRNLLKVVLVGGVFDVLHPGHIHTLRAARAQGDILVVVIARNSTANKINKDRKIYHNESLRRELVSSLSLVDLAVIGKEGTLYDTVEIVKPDIIALGYDQAHSEKEIAENCRKRNLNVRIVRLNTPLPETKSSKIKDELGDSIYRI
jgi:FAD synthetase